MEEIKNMNFASDILIIKEFDSLVKMLLDNNNNTRQMAEEILRYLISTSIKDYILNFFSKIL